MQWQSPSLHGKLISFVSRKSSNLLLLVQKRLWVLWEEKHSERPTEKLQSFPPTKRTKLRAPSDTPTTDPPPRNVRTIQSTTPRISRLQSGQNWGKRLNHN
eukprot:3186841-Amphidinium_carterae.1